MKREPEFGTVSRHISPEGRRPFGELATAKFFAKERVSW